MNQNPFMVGTLEQKTIVVRVGHDPGAAHIGTLTIDDWTVKCAVGRGGLVEPQHKREGDGKTPIGRYPLRYGFYDPDVFGDAPRGFDFPFLPKPPNYRWIEDPGSAFYNKLVFETDETQPSRRGESLFDLFIPVGWNDSLTMAAGGSAIFMHAARPDYSGTAGCVVVAHEDLLELGRRLRPGMYIDIAPVDHEAKAPAPLVAAAPQAIESVTFHGLRPGPRVIVTGAVHGNEPAGPYAIARLIAEFRSGARLLERGTLTFVPLVNGLAFRQNTRAGHRNLNRNLSESPIPRDNEDRVANVLCPLLRAHDVLIDLHSFNGEGEAFALIGPQDNTGALEPFAYADAEAALAKAMNLPLVVHGWLAAHEKAQGQKQAAGVNGISSLQGVGTTEYMRFSGGYGVTVECGQHLAPDAQLIGYECVVNGLAHLGVITAASPAIRKPRVLEIVDVILAAHEDDRLVRPFKACEAVTEGEVIGRRADGTDILAPYDGAVIFASMNAEANHELCYLCTPSSRLG
ncbi:L,D-transpeptidase family protein [Nordella sp. HKS 07]|uniref:L,D-transpeptidase family protein n=1 Tax=Nordella sp. HKS 07 TaxID=2712222 RepID=UPI0013E0F5F2|nr:succinylglutamate desuccinylase/aspartoacylase family protein [Nordella sp. HKS 07]QIG50754.1 L,D-transpeptidase family protein [Nordella sp. HKS 07]